MINGNSGLKEEIKENNQKSKAEFNKELKDFKLLFANMNRK